MIGDIVPLFRFETSVRFVFSSCIPLLVVATSHLHRHRLSLSLSLSLSLYLFIHLLSPDPVFAILVLKPLKHI